MNKQVVQTGQMAVLVIAISAAVYATEMSSPQTKVMAISDLDQLVGQPVDISPWAYVWRDDRKVQEKPEAYFIPRRLDRIDKVYRTAYHEMSESDLKSIYYNQPDLLSPLLPKPKGKLLTGLLWTGRLADYQVQLHWPNGAGIPSPQALEVRTYPTAWGWFGWTADKILMNPEISKDRRCWTYKSRPGAKMDLAYSAQTDAATEMVAVFYQESKDKGDLQSVVPDIRVTSANVGVWQRLDVEIEWGFQDETDKADFDGRIETHVGIIGPVSPFSDDKGTEMTGAYTWKSRGAGDGRRGIVVPLLYAPNSRTALDTRVTLWTKTTGFTFRPVDLENGPILIPEHRVFITKAGSGKTARQFVKELEAKNLKSICRMVREHPEAASWDQLMHEVRLWTCPDGTAVPPFAQVEDPPMQVQLPDPRWTDAWRSGSAQLKGRPMWGSIAFEVGRVAYGMELIGLHEQTEPIYQHFLKSPGVKPDGDYSDGNGALEWASSMRHDMGYSHDGTHASTGILLFAMSNHYFLTRDKEWFLEKRDRLQAAADWIIRQRREYMKEIPNRDALFVAGLKPPAMLGDYALPACDWHWYYVDNAYALQGLRLFADALTEIDPKAGKEYKNQAEAYRKDIRRVVAREAALSPVRLGRDGTYRTYIPRMAYAAGLTGPELGAPQFPNCDLWMGALPLAGPSAVMDADDPRIFDTLHVTEELATSTSAVKELEEKRSSKALPTEDAWFWNTFATLPKASFNANIFLLQDDVPNFLRFWMNSYAAMVGADGKMWEHAHLGGYTNCQAPDNGTAGWFMENFRNMLVMEYDQSLWIARGTPRVWLQQGKKIAVRNAPTYFGALAYEIISDVDNGRITAIVEMPNRNPPESVIVRFRHPQATKIKNVNVNGKPWKRFNKDNETVVLKGLKGNITVIANY